MEHNIFICPKCGKIKFLDVLCPECGTQTLEINATTEDYGNWFGLSQFKESQYAKPENYYTDYEQYKEYQRWIFNTYCVPFGLSDENMFNARIDKEVKEFKTNYLIYIEKKKISNASDKVKCPKCGSTQIQLVKRKWTPLMGVFTNKVDRVCVNCKHKF